MASGDPQLHPGIRTACYEEVRELLQNDPPDLISLLMPNFMRTDVEDLQQGYVPEEVLDLLPPEALVVFSSRFQLSQEKVLQEMGPDLVLPQTRCPFSAGAGDPNVHYDDNGWIFATRAAAVSRVLRHTPSPGMLKGSRTQKVKTLFWGIVDLKYDAFKPVLDRIQVLETGRGLSNSHLVLRIRKLKQPLSSQCLLSASHSLWGCQTCDCSCGGDGRISKFSGQMQLALHDASMSESLAFQAMVPRYKRLSRHSTTWRRRTWNCSTSDAFAF